MYLSLVDLLGYLPTGFSFISVGFAISIYVCATLPVDVRNMTGGLVLMVSLCS